MIVKKTHFLHYLFISVVPISPGHGTHVGTFVIIAMLYSSFMLLSIDIYLTLYLYASLCNHIITAGTIAAIGGNNQGVVGVNRNGKLNLVSKYNISLLSSIKGWVKRKAHESII